MRAIYEIEECARSDGLEEGSIYMVGEERLECPKHRLHICIYTNANFQNSIIL